MTKFSGSKGIAALTRTFRAPSSEAAIRAACARLLRQCGIERPPISLKKVLSHLGTATEITDDPLNSDAVLHAERGQFTIRIGRRALTRNWQRARFTIAHECGHILLYHHLKNTELISSLDSTAEAHAELERLCDIAASELLMPHGMLRAAVQNHGITPNGLHALREIFAVSRKALIQGVARALPGTDFFIWRLHARTAFEESTFRVVRAPRYHPSGARPWLPAGSTARHVSPRIIEEAVRDQKYILEDNLEIALNRRRWHGRGFVTFFPKVSRDYQYELGSFEESVRDIDSIYLFVGARNVTSARQFIGIAHGG
jgi:hypothetical protein